MFVYSCICLLVCSRIHARAFMYWCVFVFSCIRVFVYLYIHILIYVHSCCRVFGVESQNPPNHPPTQHTPPTPPHSHNLPDCSRPHLALRIPCHATDPPPHPQPAPTNHTRFITQPLSTHPVFHEIPHNPTHTPTHRLAPNTTPW